MQLNKCDACRFAYPSKSTVEMYWLLIKRRERFIAQGRLFKFFALNVEPDKLDLGVQSHFLAWALISTILGKYWSWLYKALHINPWQIEKCELVETESHLGKDLHTIYTFNPVSSVSHFCVWNYKKVILECSRFQFVCFWPYD